MTSNHRQRRGNAMIVGLALFPLLGFGALSVDIGMQRVTSYQLESAAQSGSLAGAAMFNSSEEGIAAAEARALEIANLNGVTFLASPFTAEDVVAGTYDTETGTFTPWDGSGDPATVNAVRVFDSEGADDDNLTAGWSIDSLLGKAAFGISELGVEGDAIAIQPRRGVPKYVDCYLPIAIPHCLFTQYDTDGDNRADLEVPPMRLDSTSGDDQVAWGLPYEIYSNSINPGDVASHLFGSCDSANGASGSTDMIMEPNNGLGNNFNLLDDAINLVMLDVATLDTDGPTNIDGNTIPWPRLRDDVEGFDYAGGDSQIWGADDLINTWGNSIAGPVPILYMPSETDCLSIDFESSPDTLDIAGWGYGYIYDVSNLAGDKSVYVQFDFVNEYDIGHGMCEGNCFGNLTGTGPSTLVL